MVFHSSKHSIANFIGLPYFSGFLLGLKSRALISHDYLSQSKSRSHCWDVFDWPDCFYLGGLGANRNVSGKLSMKLAIEHAV